MAEMDEFPPEVIDEFQDSESQLTDEQKLRIEENRRKALELKRKRQQSKETVPQWVVNRHIYLWNTNLLVFTSTVLST